VQPNRINYRHSFRDQRLPGKQQRQKHREVEHLGIQTKTDSSIAQQRPADAGGPATRFEARIGGQAEGQFQIGQVLQRDIEIEGGGE
jgi:hypothetical protein